MFFLKIYAYVSKRGEKWGGGGGGKPGKTN